ncbi:hypothetical protein RB614_38645 [Phytohabitans sp. ZYX-F-186]|uniref:MftR C-terminal domain-containing protein n=1 Tax=Phytohabitans maris TaxID=3071409 RepID=A0ABU0ZW43_9ACTN|nr:hypothetical protein [Phytohabitans sp. ZYX-F-186]MDQ7910430.1 hypothetical protein [Phytohabitans sp. ZYX-F-186]
MTGRRPPVRRRRARPVLVLRSRRAPARMTPAQAAAWEVCRAIDTGLLPTLRQPDVDRIAVRSHLGAVALRIVRHRSLWGEHGAMLVAGLHCAMGLFGLGEHADLAGLARDLSDRLYLLSITPGEPDHRPE